MIKITLFKCPLLHLNPPFPNYYFKKNLKNLLLTQSNSVILYFVKWPIPSQLVHCSVLLQCNFHA